MPPVGFEPTISAGERPKTYALDRAATETGPILVTLIKFLIYLRGEWKVQWPITALAQVHKNAKNEREKTKEK